MSSLPGCVGELAHRFATWVTCRTWLAKDVTPHRSAGERVAGNERSRIVGSVIKKRRKRMAKKKHRKLLKRTRIQRRRAGK
jgi:Mitochondrial domain of unknown function (DUF1713)